MKILIIAAGIHEKNGTGITLKNLVKLHPKDQICIITNRENAQLSYAEGYHEVFILGENTELININSDSSNPNTSSSNYAKKQTPLKKLVNIVKNWALDYGLYYKESNHRLNPALIAWINKQKPDLIYSVSYHIPLTLEIKNHFNIPIVLHIMDDWMRTEIKPGLMHWYWYSRLNNNIRRLIASSSHLIAISDKMANEYQARFGGTWSVFHNPLIMDDWNIDIQSANNHDDCFKIAYFGRITEANSDIMKLCINAIDSLPADQNLQLHIYSQKTGTNSNRVYYHQFINHSELPGEMAKYDLLLLPFYFDEKWTLYARLSMPTKASEYMMSGVPILLISPVDTALYELVKASDSAFILSDFDADRFIRLIKEIVDNPRRRERVSQNALNLAKNRFDSKIVGRNFINLLENTVS